MKFFEKLILKKGLAKQRIAAGYYFLRSERVANHMRCFEYIDWLNHKNKDNLGDFWEFGVASGHTLIHAHYAKKYYKNLKNMKIVGFDSFEGLPESSSEKDPESGWYKGSFAYGMDSVHENLKSSGISPKEVTLVPGFYEDSLTAENLKKFNLNKVSYVHVDCDYYTSTKTLLDFIKPHLTPGAIIDFDDYYCYSSTNYGEPKAFQEWIEENPDITCRTFSRYSSMGKTYTVTVEKTN